MCKRGDATRNVTATFEQIGGQYFLKKIRASDGGVTIALDRSTVEQAGLASGSESSRRD
jgi:hypothetical protein